MPDSKPLSKRKLESYRRAEMACQEFRYQVSHAQHMDMNAVLDYVLYWMESTGDLKYERPVPPKKHKLFKK